jgi:hypothetical protein
LGLARRTFSERFARIKNPALIALAAIAFLAIPFSFLPLPAQERGPLPPASTEARTPAPSETIPPQPAATPQTNAPGISKAPPSIPVEQIIQRFAAAEEEFKTERDNFTYVQTFVIETLNEAGKPDGEYRMTSDILFTPSGKRYENVTYAPPPTLTRISMSEQDLDDLKNIQPFVLRTEELPKYDITYVGRENVDFVGTYVFDVGPKKLEKNQRYFQGRIWVDDQDLQIVKTFGKAVPDIRKGGTENVFPRFETYRENIEGHYWFPTHTRSDDVLHFRNQDVHIRMTVRYSDYKRFRTSFRIIVPPQPKPEDKPPNKP